MLAFTVTPFVGSVDICAILLQRLTKAFDVTDTPSPVRRRSRMCRTPNAKRLVLTERDLAIFESLDRYRYLRATHLHAFAGGKSEKRLKERLGHLFHQGFIDRPERQWEFAEARYRPAVYELGKRARQVLAESERCSEVSVTSFGNGPTKQFVHAVLVCECLATFEIAAGRIGELRFVPWSEILSHHTERSLQARESQPHAPTVNAVVPDGMFGLEYAGAGKKLYRFFALELDRGTMPIVRSDPKQTAILEKLRSYQEMEKLGLQRQRWGVPNLIVLVVTTTSERKDDMMRKCAQLGHAPQILFKALSQRVLPPDPGLLTVPWERMGLPPLSIATSD